MVRKKQPIPNRIIVKVQLNLNPPIAEEALVYNKTKTIYMQTEVSRNLRIVMGKRVKMFFYAKQDKDGLVTLLDEAPEQDW